MDALIVITCLAVLAYLLPWWIFVPGLFLWALTSD